MEDVVFNVVNDAPHEAHFEDGVFLGTEERKVKLFTRVDGIRLVPNGNQDKDGEVDDVGSRGFEATLRQPRIHILVYESDREEEGDAGDHKRQLQFLACQL